MSRISGAQDPQRQVLPPRRIKLPRNHRRNRPNLGRRVGKSQRSRSRPTSPPRRRESLVHAYTLHAFSGQSFLISFKSNVTRPSIDSRLFSRTRKIRCDGAKPVCHNCGRRSTGNNECTYDPVPKRRGPDKTPGARQRMARDARGEADGVRRRRRRDTSATDTTSVSTSSTCSASTPRPEIPQHPITLAPPPGSSEHSPYTSPITNYAPESNYVRSSYSPDGGGHGIAQGPDLLDASALPSFRKTAGAVRNLPF